MPLPTKRVRKPDAVYRSHKAKPSSNGDAPRHPGTPRHQRLSPANLKIAKEIAACNRHEKMRVAEEARAASEEAIGGGAASRGVSLTRKRSAEVAFCEEPRASRKRKAGGDEESLTTTPSGGEESLAPRKREAGGFYLAPSDSDSDTCFAGQARRKRKRVLSDDDSEFRSSDGGYDSEAATPALPLVAVKTEHADEDEDEDGDAPGAPTPGAPTPGAPRRRPNPALLHERRNFLSDASLKAELGRKHRKLPDCTLNANKEHRRNRGVSAVPEARRARENLRKVNSRRAARAAAQARADRQSPPGIAASYSTVESVTVESPKKRPRRARLVSTMEPWNVRVARAFADEAGSPASGAPGSENDMIRFFDSLLLTSASASKNASPRAVSVLSPLTTPLASPRAVPAPSPLTTPLASRRLLLAMSPLRLAEPARLPVFAAFSCEKTVALSGEIMQEAPAGEIMQEAPADETTVPWLSAVNPWTMDAEMDFDDAFKINWPV